MDTARRAFALDGDLRATVPVTAPTLPRMPDVGPPPVFSDGMPSFSSADCRSFRITKVTESIDATVFGQHQQFVAYDSGYHVEFEVYYQSGLTIGDHIDVDFAFGDTRYRGPVRVETWTFDAQVGAAVTVSVTGRSMYGFVAERI